MEKQKQKEVTRVFGWPDASWLRAMKMVNSLLLSDREGKRARRKLCEVTQQVITTDIDQAMKRLVANDFQVAHAFTNELLEIAKLRVQICDGGDTLGERRRDVVMVPKEQVPAKKGRPPKKISTEKKVVSKRKRKLIETILKPTEEPEAVPMPAGPPRKTISTSKRKTLDKKIDSLKESTVELETIWKSLPKAKRDDLLKLEFDEAVSLQDAQTNVMKKLVKILETYDGLDADGIKPPKGELVFTDAGLEENRAYEFVIGKATKALAEGPPVSRTYGKPIIVDLDDEFIRRDTMFSLAEEVKIRLIEAEEAKNVT